MPTLVTLALRGRHVVRSEALAIAAMATHDRPSWAWHVDDTLHISMPLDDEPVVRLPTAAAMDVQVRAASFAELVGLGRDWTEPEVRFRWTALTPTTFRRRGRYYPAPDLGALLPSLCQHWNEVAGEEHPIDPSSVGELARTATVLRLAGGTMDVDLDRAAEGSDPDAAWSGPLGVAPGTVGEVEARIASPRDAPGFADVVTLLHAAPYLGAGEHRDRGMGGTSLEFLESRGRR